jgi:Ca2+-dependent lipid-binding protein
MKTAGPDRITTSSVDPANLYGTLLLKVMKGKLYRDTEMFGKMDPFVSIEFNKNTYRTTTLNEAGKTPIWN